MIQGPSQPESCLPPPGSCCLCSPPSRSGCRGPGDGDHSCPQNHMAPWPLVPAEPRGALPNRSERVCSQSQRLNAHHTDSSPTAASRALISMLMFLNTRVPGVFQDGRGQNNGTPRPSLIQPGLHVRDKDSWKRRTGRPRRLGLLVVFTFQWLLCSNSSQERTQAAPSGRRGRELPLLVQDLL